MKTVTTAWKLYFFVLALIFVSALAHAEEKQEFVSCDYKPSPSDSVYYQCPNLEGDVHVSFFICGQSYTLDIHCPTESVEASKK